MMDLLYLDRNAYQNKNLTIILLVTAVILVSYEYFHTVSSGRKMGYLITVYTQ